MSDKSGSTWKWFGSAGHFICGHWCRFHLCTQVGSYLISTIGEYWPERAVREIHASVSDPKWLQENIMRKGDDFDYAYMKRFGFQEIGHERLYETMVFRAGKPCESQKCGCGIPSINGGELDFKAYVDAGSATKGHMEICKKWAGKKPQ